ncbi:ATP-dependent helicase, partial [Streptomyces sp. SID3343]|nr:ATP-dependent helicase [Streptomyces sp. SID3343]
HAPHAPHAPRPGVANIATAAPDAATLIRCAATFTPADPPRAGTVAFWPYPDGPNDPGSPNDPDDLGDPDPDGAADRVTVLDSDGNPVTHPAVRLSVTDAVRVLGRARRAPGAHPAAAFW